jgi:hypothetical protein
VQNFHATWFLRWFWKGSLALPASVCPETHQVRHSA